MCDIFISYNWNNKDVVEKLYNKLVGLNLNVWRDIRNLNQTNEPLTSQLCIVTILIISLLF